MTRIMAKLQTSFLLIALTGRILHPSAFLKLLMKDPLYLAIHTTEFIRRPFLQGLECFHIYTKYKVLFITHRID